MSDHEPGKISDEKVRWVDPNTAVVSYKWTGTGTFQGQTFPSPVYASTVWTKKGDKWLARVIKAQE